MKSLILSTGIFILSISCSVVLHFNVYCQTVQVLPPIFLPNDQLQIKAVISSLSRSLNSEGQNQIRGLFKSPPNFTSSKKSNPHQNKELSIEIDNINIDKNVAVANCKLKEEYGTTVNEIPIKLEKVGLSWQLIETPELSNIITPLLSNSPNQSTSMVLTQSQLNTSGEMLYLVAQPLLPTVYLLNWDVTYNNVQKRFFCTNARLDIEGIYPTTNENDGVVFFLDPLWQRIMYAADGWIKSYGDNTNDCKFTFPPAMAVDAHDTIFVADAENNRIVKLAYNPSTKLLVYVSSLTVPGISRPIDIAIDQTGTLSNPPNVSNDIIWVIDDFVGKLVGIYRSGVVYKTFESYNWYGTNRRLAHPSKVLAQDNRRVGFIDRDKNAFVVLNSLYGSTVNCTAFGIDSYLSCIGLDINNEWWVGDSRQKKYHKFDQSGQYLASYAGKPITENLPEVKFEWPVSVSKAPYLPANGTLKRSQYIYTADPWSQYTGTRTFVPGSDILYLQQIGYDNCKIKFQFILTNKSYIKVVVKALPSENIIKEYEPVLMEANPMARYDVDSRYLGSGNYAVYFYYSQGYWPNPPGPDGYPGPTEFRYYKSISVLGHPSEMYASIIPYSFSGYCCTNSSCSWKVDICPGLYSYQWYRSVDGDEWSLISGATNQILTTTIYNGDDIKCKITNNVPGGKSCEAVFFNCPPPPPPPSCPFVYTWDGSQFQEDNNILPQSEYPENIGKAVIDYYRLLKPLKSDSGKYILQIREFENEKSYLDQFKLLAVDHPTNTKIDVSPSGEIYQYVTPFSLNRARLKGIDVIQKLLAFDSSNIVLNAGDTLNLSISDLNSKISRSFQSTPGGGEGGGDNPPKIDKIAYIKPTTASSPNPAGFSFRQRPTLVFIPFTLNNSNSFNIIWEQKARLDYFNFGVTVPKTYLSQELSLASATHSANGDVRWLLLAKDNNSTTLTPGQFIELRYNSIPPPPLNIKRTFILISEGRYEKYIDSSRDGYRDQSQLAEVTTFKLQRNYPNPFNPLTRIDFQLPIDGHVTLVIYDLIGREVKRLVDGYITKGYHNFEWDASNYSSGLYICRYTVTDNFGKEFYSEIQKLIVMR